MSPPLSPHPLSGRSVGLSGNMLFSHVICAGLLPVLLSRVLLTAAAPAQRNSDPCAQIAGLSFADPADVMACQMSFPFDQDLQYNVMSVVGGVFDFYTFEEFYCPSPEPFNDSSVNIRQEIGRINGTQYEVRTLLLCSAWRPPLIVCNAKDRL